MPLDCDVCKCIRVWSSSTLMTRQAELRILCDLQGKTTSSIILCDQVDVDTTVQFQRVFLYSGGQLIDVVDLDLDGNEYTVQGTVGVC